MTTETEPMVRVLEVKCGACGAAFNAETDPDWFTDIDSWGYEPVSIRELREEVSKERKCHLCGAIDSNTLIATEPVR